MNSRIDGKLRVKDTAPNTKLLKKEFQSVASVDIANKNDAFSFDQLQFENDVCQKKFLVLGTSVIDSISICEVTTL
jgi:hypothetical protein